MPYSSLEDDDDDDRVEGEGSVTIKIGVQI